jgi:hypothetical protein
MLGLMVVTDISVVIAFIHRCHHAILGLDEPRFVDELCLLCVFSNNGALSILRVA